MRKSITSKLGCFLALSVYLADVDGLTAMPLGIEKLIQSDKYAEALIQVEVLLKATPDEPELLAAKRELSALVGRASPAATIVPSSPPQSSARATGVTPLEEKEISLILADLAKATGDIRQTIAKELMSKTGQLVGKYPNIISLWALRGIGAIELSMSDAAKEAGANLLRLGADRATDSQTLTALAMLDRKGWLLTQEELTKANKDVALENQVAVQREAKQEIQRAEDNHKTTESLTASAGSLEEKKKFDKASSFIKSKPMRKNVEAGMVDENTANFWENVGKPAKKRK